MSKQRFPELFYNPISLTGAIIASVTLGAIIILMVVSTFSNILPPYFGIVTYILLPTVMIVGLIIIPIGALVRRKKRREAAARGEPPLPRIDLNDPKQRTAFFFFATGTLLLMFLTAIGGYNAFQITESVAFCGKLCHRVMKPEYVTHLHSPHAKIACVQCHVGPGASWYVKSKLSGLYQVYATIFDKYPRPIPVPIKNLRPARITCEQCHWPQAFVGERRVRMPFYLEDSANTRWTIDMLIRVGRSTAGKAIRPSVHWHVTHTVEFLATDSTQQHIPWVRLVEADGKSETFTTSDNPFTPDSVKHLKVKTMDCMDCHNRPTHIILTPGEAVNDDMASGLISPSLPWIKQTAVNALIPKYLNARDALDSIGIAVRSFYETKYPQIATEDRSRIDSAISALRTIYSENFFPYMHVDWRAYANDIGHMDYRGCFRCHDGNHKASNGDVIPNDCQTCHQILWQGTGPETGVTLAGVPFKHPPAGIDDAWQGAMCTDCHDGTQ